jgi:hypothetical protein
MRWDAEMWRLALSVIVVGGIWPVYVIAADYKPIAPVVYCPGPAAPGKTFADRAWHPVPCACLKSPEGKKCKSER